MVAVFERIDLSLLERLLAASSGESTLEMVSFSNQPPGRVRRSLTRGSPAASRSGSR